MEKSYHNYPDIAPAMANYSRAVRVGDLFFMAGVTAGEHDGIVEQVRGTLDKIRRVLEHEGQSAGDIVKLVTYVTSIAEWQEHGQEVDAVFEELFRGSYPANTLIGISELARPNMKVEIDATAVF